jgi:CheY-specific phosphatase CheX
MPDTHTADVLESLAAALETMAFVTLEPADASTQAPADAQLVALDFNYPQAGAIQIIAPREFGRMLAMNMLMPEDDQQVPDEAADDALRELCNITTGTLLRQRLGEHHKSVMMGLPVVRAFDGRFEEFTADPDAFLICADGHTLAIRTRGI